MDIMDIMAPQNKLISTNKVNYCGLIFVLYLASVNSLFAKDNTEVTPTISVGLGYSDNVDKEHSNTKSSYIGEVSPAIRIRKQGGRVKTNVDYRLNTYAYSNSSVNDRNNAQHNLQAKMQTELAKNTFFIDMDASITQELLNNRRGDLQDSETGVDNRTETYTYGVKPYWRQKWNSFAESIVSYDYNEVRYNDKSNNDSGLINLNGNANDSKQYTTQVNVKNGRDFQTILWKLDFNHSETKYNNRINQDLTSTFAIAELGYTLNRKLIVNTKMGYEKYKEDEFISDEEDDGRFYGLGLTWRPSPKTYLDLTIGHRFYGTAYDFTFNHQADVLGINMRYSENITTGRDQLRANNEGVQDELFNDALDSGSLGTINQTNTSFYLSKKYISDITYSLKKINASLGVYHERRIYPKDILMRNQDETIYGTAFSLNYQQKKSNYHFRTHYENRDSDQFTEGGTDFGMDLSWGLKLNKRMNSNTSLSWLHKQNDNNLLDSDDRNSDEWRLRWQLNRNLSRQLTGSLSLSHQKLISDYKFDEYSENIIFVRLNKTFR